MEKFNSKSIWIVFLFYFIVFYFIFLDVFLFYLDVFLIVSVLVNYSNTDRNFELFWNLPTK